MECSKVRLLIRDIVGKRSSQLKGNKRVVGANQLQHPLSFIGSRGLDTLPTHVSKPTSPPFTITTYHTMITFLWYMLSSFSHAFIPSCFTFVCLSFFSLAYMARWSSPCVRICDPNTQLGSQTGSDISIHIHSSLSSPSGFRSASGLITLSPLSLLSPPFTLYLVTLHSFPQSFSMYA